MNSNDMTISKFDEYLALVHPYPLLYNNISLDWYIHNSGYFTAPASTKYHGNYPGGLFEHSKMVANRLMELTANNHLQWERPESPLIVGLFHDLCKCDQYAKVVTPSKLDEVAGNRHPPIISYEYNTNTLLKGHGAKSVLILSTLMQLTEEEMLCIRYHMGAYIQEEQAEFDLAIKKYETVLWTHHADMLASKVDNT